MSGDSAGSASGGYRVVLNGERAYSSPYLDRSNAQETADELNERYGDGMEFSVEDGAWPPKEESDAE